MTTLEGLIGYAFKDRELLNRALTHKSFSNENRKSKIGHNERLEFLGDAVLGMVVSHALMKHYPDDSEGSLSRKRASLVNERMLAEMARHFEIDKQIFLGKGESQNKGAENARILSSTFEALVGAIYLEAGFDRINELLEKAFDQSIRALGVEGEIHLDYKTRLQERSQKLYHSTPYYVVLEEKGPAHERFFVVEARLKDRVVGLGRGRSKKLAEQEAAKMALESASESESVV